MAEADGFREPSLPHVSRKNRRPLEFRNFTQQLTNTFQHPLSSSSKLSHMFLNFFWKH